MFPVSKRLLMLSSLCPENGPVWDIGCDHGLLGIQLLELGKTEEMHFVDSSRQVIETLQAKLTSPKYIDWWKGFRSRIHFHWARGEEVLAEARGTVVIAGMGGASISEIIKTPSVADLFVLNPLTEVEALKNELGSCESFYIEDNSRRYEILVKQKSRAMSSCFSVGNELDKRSDQIS